MNEVEPVRAKIALAAGNFLDWLVPAMTSINLAFAITCPREGSKITLFFQMRPMKYCMFLLAVRMSFLAAGQELLPEDAQDSAAKRWLNKEVIASRVLDDMESPAHWT